MDAIPQIDLSHARRSAAAEHAIAMQIDRACREIGFFTVKGHGIEPSTFENAYVASQRFFALPEDEKCASRLPTGFTSGVDDYTPYGYSALLEENAFAYMGQDGKPADYVEKFSVGRRIMDDAALLPFSTGEVPASLRSALKHYFIACEQVSEGLT